MPPKNLLETGPGSYRNKAENEQLVKISNPYMAYKDALQKFISRKGSHATAAEAKRNFTLIANEMLADENVSNEIKNHISTLIEDVSKDSSWSL